MLKIRTYSKLLLSV